MAAIRPPLDFQAQNFAWKILSLVLGGVQCVILILTPLRPSQIDSKWGGHMPPPPVKVRYFQKPVNGGLKY